MNKLFSTVLSLVLLLSVAPSSFVLPAAENNKLINVQIGLDETQVAKAGAAGLVGFAIYRLIANAQDAAGYGQLLVNGMGHLGNAVLALGPFLRVGGVLGLIGGAAYGIDYLTDHKISKKIMSYLD
jgi:hypothetical protein